jgi:hypothetical protein
MELQKHYKQNELFNWAAKIAARYMGENNAEEYGRRNSTEGEVLVRIRPSKIVVEKIFLLVQNSRNAAKLKLCVDNRQSSSRKLLLQKMTLKKYL